MALLAAVESLLSAVVADGMSGDSHNSNVELVAQGFANIASPLFGGIPATGAIARTATNIRSGALTPMAGIIHALTLLAILLVAAPLARFVPPATLAAVLFVVAYNMGEWREIGTILRLSKTDKPSHLISRSDFQKHVGAENVLPHVQAALARAQEIQADFAGVGRELAAEMEHHPL